MRLNKSGLPQYGALCKQADDVIQASKLIDIGKVVISENILYKPGKLTSTEFDQIKQHTLHSARILDKAAYNTGKPASFLHTASDVIVFHHEKWNGKGYPYGLSGDEIPLSARVMTIVDVYAALVSLRPYKKELSHDAAVEIINNSSSLQFDPEIIELAGEALHEFRHVRQLV